MRSTPFDEAQTPARAYLEQNGLEFVAGDEPCDIFLADSLPPWWYSSTYRAQLFLRYPWRARLLLWTNEPRYNQCDRSPQCWSRWQPPLHVMNVYTGDVFFSNFTGGGWAVHGPLPYKALSECPLPGKARIVGMMGHVEPSAWIVGGIDRDLNHLRMALLIEGHRRGRLDIYGKGWPNGVAKEDSRGGTWWERKLEVIRNYDICIAIENTSADYYCTEKIWQALAGGCLPIYDSRRNRIYDTFPRDSFLDTAEFADVGKLLDYIDQMSQREFCDRYNRCIDANNRARRDYDFVAEQRPVWNAILGKMRAMIAGNGLWNSAS